MIRCTLASTGVFMLYVAVDTASPAEVSTEGRTCAEVLHSLSKGDETMGTWDDLSQVNLAWSSMQFAVLSDYTPENRTKRETYNTRNVLRCVQSRKQQRESSHWVWWYPFCDIISPWDSKSVKCKTRQMPFMANPSNFMPTNIFTLQ